MDNQVNRKKLVYQSIAKRGIVSKTDLLGQYELSTSTMNRLLEELTGDGYIEEVGFGPSSGGRKPILYQASASRGYIVGLEISRFYSALGLFDLHLNAKTLIRWRMDEDMTPEAFVVHAARQLDAMLKDHRLGRELIIGIGIGAVGPLDREKGRILKPLHFRAPGWTDVPICELIERETGIPAMLDNGANTALMGEQWAMRDERPDLQHALYVHAGVSLRSAMMSHGQIVHGKVDMEGSIGQMIIQAGGERLGSHGNYGALESYVSVRALEKLAQTEAKIRRDELLPLRQSSPDTIAYDRLLSELSQNNAQVLELFLRTARHFGIGLANLINVFHPELIILGGPLVTAHERFYQTAIEVALTHTYYYPEYVPAFSKGVLREDAVATGAAHMVWKAMSV
ncbi:ROK family protein [Paenibacillus xanthanilyticus]|uniref:ROK family protein n=1 Tax=Paenibacillus xanthanilyticus TaxID=1783531 RepID=A0ABV8K601_9BACL